MKIIIRKSLFIFIAVGFMIISTSGIIRAQHRDDIHITTNTTWSGSVNVPGDVYIDENVTLTVDPGTTVTFNGFFGIRVLGNIIAEGSASDSISFVPSNTATGWNRILFEFTPSDADSSKFSFCSFRYSKATQSTSLPDEAGGAFYIGYFSKIKINNCRFMHNYAMALGGAIFCSYTSPDIINNIFDNNSSDIDGGAIGLDHSHPRIIGNLFVNNQTEDLGGAINFSGSNPNVTNNTFADNHAGYNGGAVNIDAGSKPTFTNCIFYNNSADQGGDEVSLTTNAGDPDFYYCLVSGGVAAFGGNGAGDYNGNYENNLDTDPFFMGSGNEPFNIQVISPCLNAGTPDISGLDLPALDLAGNPRVAAGCDERIDIGAYENQSQATSSFSGTLTQDAHWCADTVTITGDMTVDDGVTLTIEKGTVIYIAGGFNINIQGNVVAIGEENDSVVFTTDPVWPYWSWEGISLNSLNAGNDSSIFRYCRFDVSGLTNDTGGAMSIDNWNKVEISNCSFRSNYGNHGGGLAVSNSIITIDSCSFVGNITLRGAGLYASSSTITLSNTEFRSNTAQNGDCSYSNASHGGGVFLNNCTTTITNCVFDDNHADCSGGGIYAIDGLLILENDSIKSNSAANCTSSGGGGGIYCNGLTLTLKSSYIVQNSASFGGGILLTGTDAEVLDNDISHNTAGVSGCIISEAGGIVVSGGSDVKIMRNRITHNYAAYNAAMALGYCSPDIVNNLIAENHAGTAGGAISFNHASPLLLNNTICNNHADNFAGCLHFGSNSNSSPVLKNCIIYGNYVIYYDGDNVYMYDNSGAPNFYYCDLEGGVAGFGGYFDNYTGVIENTSDTNPLFKNSGEYPYQLQAFSPCLNTGDPATDTTDAGSTDLAGNPRIQNGRIDMGAYENYRNADGYAGDAIHFAESNDVVVLENENRFDFDESFSVEFWMNCDEMSDGNYCIIKKGGAWAVNMFYSEMIAIPDFAVDSTGVFADYQTTGTALLNKWNHIAGVCKKRDEGGFDVMIYFNGNKGTQDIEFSLTHNNTPVTIGKDFLGRIDELRIWNKALTQQEIREHMHLVIPPQDSLVTYQQFDTNYDTVLVDIAGGNNGIIRNMDAETSLVPSTMPAGRGSSNSRTVYSTGNVDFTGTDLSMNFTEKFGEDIFVVTNLDTTPNLNPSLFDNQYWIVEQYGTGSFTSDLTFTVEEDITAEDASSPSRLKLYKRDSNADTYWDYFLNATSADDGNNQATFDGINSLSQFAVCRRLTPDQEAENLLKFDGDLDYVEGTGIPATLKAFTIEVWVYHNSLPQEVQRYVSISPEAAVLRFDGSTYGGSDELHFYISDIDSNMHSIRANGVLQTGIWQHIAGTYDGNDMKLYYNGELVKTASPGKELLSPSGGYSFSHVSETLDGRLDEIRIWNYARDIDDIRSDMYRTLPNTTDRGMVAYWQFDEGTGLTASELVGQHNGTLHHMDNSNWDASTVPVPFQSTADGNWSATATWASGQGVPQKDWSRVQINNNVGLDQDETAEDLAIQPSASLTISSTNNLTVTGSLTNENGTGGLVLKSDASGTGSLIQPGSDVSATCERYIPQYTGDIGWHFISAPVSAQAIRPDFVPNVNPIPGSNDFYYFDEITNYWINTRDDQGNWNTNFEDHFVVGRGYNVAYESDVTKEFKGPLNSGDLVLNTTTTPAITYTESGARGWNLLGNPFPSGIDWDECSRSNIDGAVYTYDGDAGQYVSWNGSVGSLTDGILPPMNAFFIKASDNAVMTIPESARVHTSTNLYKSTKDVDNLLILKVEGNGYSDLTYVHFNPSATNQFDSDFDAYKLMGIEAAPQLYTRIGDTKLSINELPYSSDEITIPLSLKVGQDGEYSISVAQNTFWETVDISLRDFETQITYDLLTNNPLTFYQSTHNSPDRFLLLINGATGIEETLHDEHGIEIYTCDDQVFIKSDQPAEVRVYNLLGQIVLAENLSGFRNLTGLVDGFYIITVKNGKAAKTEKVFIQ